MHTLFFLFQFDSACNVVLQNHKHVWSTLFTSYILQTSFLLSQTKLCLPDSASLASYIPYIPYVRTIYVVSDIWHHMGSEWVLSCYLTSCTHTRVTHRYEEYTHVPLQYRTLHTCLTHVQTHHIYHSSHTCEPARVV